MVHLRPRVERGDDQQDGDGRTEQRRCDVAEALHGVGTVEPRRVQQVFRYSRQPRKKEQHVIAGVFLHRDGDDRGQRQRRVAEPVVCAKPR